MKKAATKPLNETKRKATDHSKHEDEKVEIELREEAIVVEDASPDAAKTKTHLVN